MHFYTVIKGRIPGIYTDWNECKKQVDDFSGAIFRIFSGRTENYLSENLSKSLNTPKVFKTCAKNIYEWLQEYFGVITRQLNEYENLQKTAQCIWDDIENINYHDRDECISVINNYKYTDYKYTDKDLKKNDEYNKFINLFMEAIIKDRILNNKEIKD